MKVSLEMTQDLNALMKKWQNEGKDPVICTYSILMRFSAVACGLIEDEDLFDFLNEAREQGMELYAKSEEGKTEYAH